MKIPHRYLSVYAVFAGIFLLGHAESAPQVSSVSVSFIDPSKFTDVKEGWSSTESSDEARRDAVIDELKGFLEKKAQPHLLAGQSLQIKITDVDLAGDFEPWRGANFDDVRIIKDIYPPRVSLEFVLTGADGAKIKEGKRELRDLSFMMTAAFPTSDSLRYEKEMLGNWLSGEFKQPKK